MERDKALAGFVLGGLLFALALPDSPPVFNPCRNPVEVAAVVGHTVAVRCDGEAARAGEIRGPARQLFGMEIDLNCADAPTLEILSGIGAARARAILEERRIRPFSDVDELTRVRGIGPKTLERLRPLIGVNSDLAISASVQSRGCHSEGETSVRPAAGGRG